MLLICDLYIPGMIRERLLVAFYRYSTSQSQSNVDDVCKLLRDTGYDQQHKKRPADYPVEYFGRVNIHPYFIEKVIGKLRSEDIYNQLAVYTTPEHQASALATQASMLVVCLFFMPQYLHSDVSKMREIADKFFPSNWIIPIYMGVTVNVIDYWENFKAAKLALSNTCNSKMVKEVFSKRGSAVPMLINKTHQLLKEGVMTDDFVLDNINKILNLLINSNFVLRWLLLHNSHVIFYDTNKKSKQLKELVLKESGYDPLKILELLISTAELELKVREMLNRLLENRNESWNTSKTEALEALNNLAELFSGDKSFTKVKENDQLKQWFTNIANQIKSVGESITTKSMKKITQLIQALDEVEEFHGIKSASTVLQFLSESKDALKNALRAASLKEDSLVTLEIAADVSYAWCIIDSYTQIMQESIKDDPAVTSRLRALFLKLASAMEIPLLRINQAHSDDLISVSQYYSSELIKYIQKVLQIIPEMVFSIVEKIIDLQTWTIKEIPTRLDKERLKEFAQLEHRMEVAKLTHSASTFTTGILDMRSTLVGVIRVDPAELLEDGLLKELDTHISKKFVEFLEPQSRKPLAPNTLLIRLQKLAESMDGYKRSLEYIQDYINIHGLRIWQKQVSAIIVESVAKEISLRKGVTLYSPSAGFMGSLARQIAQLTDARVCSYINICTAWFDIKSQTEIVNTKTFAKLNEAIGVVGLHGLDTLYAFMIKNQLQTVQQIFKSGQDKINVSNLNVDVKDIELAITKGQKILQQLADVIVLIGTLQVLRRHIAYQLNSTAKFDSAHLESSLQTMNESLLNELKINPESNPKVTAELLKYLEDYLVRCGIYEPFEKIYIRNAAEFSIVDMGRVCAILLISQLTKMQFCQTTGDLISRKAGENIDGYPFLVGIYTLLRQVGRDNIETFVSFLSAYMKNATLSKSKSSEVSYEGACIGRVLEIFCETFKYNYNKIEDKLPIAMLTQTFQK
ncbi:WASH complex subunit 5-like isoform X2 [Choristoneura fumiferana]